MNVENSELGITEARPVAGCYLLIINTATIGEDTKYYLTPTTTLTESDNANFGENLLLMSCNETDWHEVPPLANAIDLTDNADNSEVISENDGVQARVTLTGRTLYRDGEWNTLCLPFNVTLSGSPLQGATARPLESASISGSTLNLQFGDAVDELVAGTPYIIKWDNNIGSATNTAISGTNGFSDGEGYASLVDGNTATKWCSNTTHSSGNPWVCEFTTSSFINVTGYTLTTGGDTQSYSDRNPQKWTLEAKADDTDDWIVIDSRDVTTNGGDALPAANTTESQVYAIASEKQGSYLYFRFKVSQSGGDIMQLAELNLQGTIGNTPNIFEPIFNGMTISSAKHDYDNGASGAERVRFIGTYAPLSFDAENKSILFMGDGNVLYYPLNGASIGAQRAYFMIGDGVAPARQLTAFSINFGDSEATGIISLTPDPSPKGEGSEYWYTLDGRRLDGKPSRAGVYINNGMKVVIK